MNVSKEYKEIQKRFQKITSDEVIKLHIPADVLANEGKKLYFWAKEDIKLLVKSGLKKEVVDELSRASEALLIAENVWKHDVKSELVNIEKWKEMSPKAYELRDELLHAFKYAFRDDEVILKSVYSIQEGNTNSDLIEDLHGLKLLGDKYIDRLSIINFDTQKLKLAGEMSIEISNILAQADGDKNRTSEIKTDRDKAFTYLKKLIDEVRACGKYVFWKNENRLKGYRSDYNHKKYTEWKKSKSE